MNIKVINCEGKYLSENVMSFPFADALGINFINKGITGCGGTTLAIETTLEEGWNTIILMPTVPSVISKEGKYDSRVQLLYGEIRDIFFNPFNDANVIIATYDKFETIKKQINPGDWRLVIDEYHTLTRDASYRDCMAKVLNDWEDFYSVSLLSATPDRYLEEAVEEIYSTLDIQKIEYKWNKKSICKLINIEGSLHTYIVELVKNWDSDDNLYLMLNNVKEIQKVINDAQLTESDYHIICSQSRKNEINISTPGEISKDLRKINFISAAGFEGTDIQDPSGVIYTVVDMAQNSTIFDWLTIIQMWGRCRGSENYPVVLYHYSELRHDQVVEINREVSTLKIKKLSIPMMTVKEIEEDPDYLIMKGKIIINPFFESRINRRKEVFDNCQTYKDIFNYLHSRGIIIATGGEKVAQKNYKKETSFKTLFLQYVELNAQKSQLRDQDSLNKNGLATVANAQFLNNERYKVLVINSYTKLGADKVKSLDYSPIKVKRALELLDSVIKDPKIIMGLTSGRFYSSKSIEKKIEETNIIMEEHYHTKHLKDTLTEMGYIAIDIMKKVAGKNCRGFEVYDKTPGEAWTKSPVKSIICSIATKAGSKVSNPLMEPVDFKSTVKPRPVEKKNQWLFSECYSSKDSKYSRSEASFTLTDSLVLDIDDCGWTIEQFNEYVKDYFGNAIHYIYKSFSYTEEVQKFRVVFPLSKTLVFNPELDDTKNFKKAKVSMFPEVLDPNCQLWYYGATEEPESYGDSTITLDTDYIRNLMNHICIMKGEETDVIEIKKPELTKKETKETYISNSVSRAIDEINSLCYGEHNWDNTIHRIVWYLDWTNVSEVRNGIKDPEKIKLFDAKLKYKKH